MLFAIGLIQHHRESFRAHSSGKDRDNVAWFVSQFRRRMFASSLIALIGVLFIADSVVLDIYWSVVMVCMIVLLLLVIFMFAMVDFYRTQQRLRPNIRHAVDARQELYDEADRLIVERQRQIDGGSHENSEDGPDADA